MREVITLRIPVDADNERDIEEIMDALQSACENITLPKNAEIGKVQVQ